MLPGGLCCNKHKGCGRVLGRNKLRCCILEEVCLPHSVLFYYFSKGLGEWCKLVALCSECWSHTLWLQVLAVGGVPAGPCAGQQPVVAVDEGACTHRRHGALLPLLPLRGRPTRQSPATAQQHLCPACK